MEGQKELVEVGAENVFSFTKDGDNIEGTLVEKPEGQHGQDYIIECNSGERFRVWGHSVLRTKLKDVKVGEWIKIEYIGVKPSKEKAGFNYKDYRVFRAAQPIPEEKK